MNVVLIDVNLVCIIQDSPIRNIVVECNKVGDDNSDDEAVDMEEFEESGMLDTLDEVSLILIVVS